MAQDAHRNALVQFVASLDALDELTETIAPTAERLDDTLPRVEALLDRYTSQLEGDRKAELAKWAGYLAATMVLPQLEAAAIGESREGSRSSPPIEGLTEESLGRLRDLRDLDTATLPQDSEFSLLAFEFLFDFRKVVVRRSRKSIVLKSLLTSTLDALEVLVSQVLVAFFTLHPEAVGPDEKEFSLAELRDIGSIDEAFTVCVARKVDSLMRDGFGEWQRYFSRNLKVDFESIAIDYSYLVEVSQRRNALVHAQGRVTRQYQRVVGASSPALGTVLDVDSEYLARAMDHIRCFGVLLAMAAWIHAEPAKASEIYPELERVNYNQMQAGRWAVVKQISQFGFTALEVPESSRLVFRFNYWLALKRLGEEFRIDVEAFDDSAVTLDFRIVRLALLDRSDDAISLARTAIDHGDMSRKSLREWPVFADLRDLEGFRELAFVLTDTPVAPHRDAPAPIARKRRPRQPLPN